MKSKLSLTLGWISIIFYIIALAIHVSIPYLQVNLVLNSPTAASSSPFISLLQTINPILPILGLCLGIAGAITGKKQIIIPALIGIALNLLHIFFVFSF